MAFRVGQKVVCVDVSPALFGQLVPLTLNAIYTISEIDPENAAGPMSFRLHGVGGRGFLTGLFHATRFRPIVEHKTDISIFTKMLTDKRVDA